MNREGTIVEILESSEYFNRWLNEWIDDLKGEKLGKELHNEFTNLNKVRTLLKQEPCKHDNGCMIPQTDSDGKYVKPQYMICSGCQKVVPVVSKT